MCPVGACPGHRQEVVRLLKRSLCVGAHLSLLATALAPLPPALKPLCPPCPLPGSSQAPDDSLED